MISFLLIIIGLLLLSNIILLVLWYENKEDLEEVQNKLEREESLNRILKTSLEREKAVTAKLRKNLKNSNELLEKYVPVNDLFNIMFNPNKNS